VNRILLCAFFLLCSLSSAITPLQSCRNWIARAATSEYWLNSGPYVAVVDPLSSGRLLAERLTARGYRVLAVHSSVDIVPALVASYRPRSVVRDFFPKRELDVAGIEAMASRLSAYVYPNVPQAVSLQAVFNGSEGGTVLADSLTHLLGLPGNQPSLSQTKRDKGRMHQRLKEKNIAHISFLRTKHLEKVLAWVYGPNEGKFPVVIKPVDSAATQGVSICESEAEIIAAFTELMSSDSPTVFQHKIEEVLVQEFLQGVEENSEYVVNTASSGGRHIVTDVVRYQKRKVLKANGSHAIIYLYDEMMALDHPVALRLREYAFKVLDATGVVFGPSHMEVMLTARGPILVEVGARPAGSGMPDLAAKAYPYHPLDITIDAYLNPGRFSGLWVAESAQPGSRQKFLKHARQVEFISPRAGVLTSLPYLGSLKQLRSYVSHSISVGIGEQMNATEDLLTSPGHVELAHEDAAIVEQDYRTVRQWEQSGFFQVH
jgi:D-alanine-D-alanine ligase-like ATP-grasp enzyme